MFDSVHLCPYCGAMPRLDHRSSLSIVELMLKGSDDDFYRAHCASCGLSMPWTTSIQGAIASWDVVVKALRTSDGTPIKDLTREQVVL